MTKKDEYDYITDYCRRRPSGDPTFAVLIGAIYVAFQLVCWLCGQFWFWTILLPIVVGAPIITWRKTRDKQKTFINGVIAIFACVLLAMLFATYFG